MQRVVDSMAKIVGLPLVQRTPTKFVLRPFTDLSLDESPGSPRGDPLEQWLQTALGDEPLMVFDVEKIYVLLNRYYLHHHTPHTRQPSHTTRH